jgi:hypothetical protein
MGQEIHPKVLTGAKLKKVDKYGDYIFTSDDGTWKIPPAMLIGITSRDLYATGKLVRVAKNGKDRYQWVEDIEEQPATQTQPIIKQDGLTRGLSVGKTIAKKILRVGG